MLTPEYQAQCLGQHVVVADGKTLIKVRRQPSASLVPESFMCLSSIEKFLVR